MIVIKYAIELQMLGCIFYSEIARKEVEMSRREVPVVLITGYLGSGKTTLM